MTITTALLLGVILGANVAVFVLLAEEVHKVARHRLQVRLGTRCLRRLDERLSGHPESIDNDVANGPTPASEAEESALCHQLIDGLIDAGAYQRAMTALAWSRETNKAAR